MSMFSLPEDFAIDAKPMETMLKTWSDAMNADGLTAPVLGSPAAAAALGAGVVAQAWGTWLGAIHGMAGVAHRLHSIDSALMPAAWFWNAEEGDEQAFAMSWPFGFLAGAARTALADMERTARDFVEVSEHVTEEVADEADFVATEIEHVVEDSSRVAAELADQAQAPAGQALLPEDFVAPKRIDRPEVADDLKMIAGIGPKLEKALNDLGVWTFAQIADWSPAEIAWVDDYLSFKGRIERDGWIEQAAALDRGGRDEYEKVFGKEPK